MNCDKYQDFIPLYIDDMLTKEEKTELEEHFTSCPKCREELNILKNMISVLSQMDDVSPPPDFRDNLRKKLLSQKKKTKFDFGWKKFTAAAAVFLIGISIYTIGQNMLPKSSRQDYSGDNAEYRGIKIAEPTPSDMGSFGIMAEDASPPSMDSKTMDIQFGRAREVEITNFEMKVIYNGNLRLVTEKFQKVYDSIIDYTVSNGGYIEHSNIWHDKHRGLRHGEITLRIPDNLFFATLDVINDMEVEIESSSFNSFNVTEEYYDIENRVTNLKKQEERIREILASAETVEEILKVEQELNRIRTNIESLEGRLNFLDHQVSFSTISISIREMEHSITTIQSTGFKGLGSRMVRAFISSINRIIDKTANVLTNIAGIIPGLVIIAAIIFALWKLFGSRLIGLFNRIKN